MNTTTAYQVQSNCELNINNNLKYNNLKYLLFNLSIKQIQLHFELKIQSSSKVNANETYDGFKIQMAINHFKKA